MIVSRNDSIQLSGTDWKRRSLRWRATVENTEVLSVKTNNSNYRNSNNYGVKGVCLLPQINIKLRLDQPRCCSSNEHGLRIDDFIH